MRSLFRYCVYKQILRFRRSFCTKRSRTVLGIETSCDETGAAIVNEDGHILGEALNSQMKVHLENGGVIPHIAKYFHEQNISEVVSSALKQSGLTLNDLSAMAATAKPGLGSSLKVGLEYGKMLAKQAAKPFIPVHHMEAHSLTIRMVEKAVQNHSLCVQFPFLVLLASGGHCQLAVVKNVEEFLLLGTSHHNSPGEVLDKIARRLKLKNLPECSSMSGGQAIDFMAEGGDPHSYKFPYSMTAYRDCNFSFSGYGTYAMENISEEEIKHDVPADGVIPTVKDFCASLLQSYSLHLMHRVERALIFCDQKNLLPLETRTLVFSGGVACNKYIKKALAELCDTMSCRFACPPPKLCTDNGVMIAWNGMEKLKSNIGIYDTFDDIQPQSSCILGKDMMNEVKEAAIKVKIGKLGQNQTLSKVCSQFEEDQVAF